MGEKKKTLRSSEGRAPQWFCQSNPEKSEKFEKQIKFQAPYWQGWALFLRRRHSAPFCLAGGEEMMWQGCRSGAQCGRGLNGIEDHLNIKTIFKNLEGDFFFYFYFFLNQAFPMEPTVKIFLHEP